MQPPRQSLDELVTRIVKREQGTRRRVLLYTGIPVLLALLVLSFTGLLLHRWQQQVRKLKAEAAHYQAQNELAQATIRELEQERQQLQRRFEHSVNALPVVQEAIREHHKGHYDAAVNLYNKALQEDPENSYVLDLRGYTLIRAGKLQDAILSLEQSVAKDPRYARGYYNLTKAYCATGLQSNAKRAANQAVTLQPDMKQTMRADGEFHRYCNGVIAFD